MIYARLDRKKIAELSEELGGNAKRLRKEIAIATNNAAKPVRKEMVRVVTQELAVKQAVVAKQVNIPKKATAESRGTIVRLKKSKQIPLKEFGARQTKKGVGYKISKRTGRKTINGAFQGPKPGTVAMRLGGHVFKRLGKSRLPIIKLFGPSPWGVFVKRKYKPEVVLLAKDRFREELDKRIRFHVLKKKGKLNWQN
jgi:hypothetical protein